MNSVGDVQLNEERRADAYNEVSLRKGVLFFPNPLVLPWKRSPFLNVRDHQSSSLAPTDSTTACYWQAKIRWTKKTWRRGKTGACGRWGRDKGQEEAGVEKRRERVEAVLRVPGRQSYLHRPASRHSWYGTLSPVFSRGVESRRDARYTVWVFMSFCSKAQECGRARSALREGSLRSAIEILRMEF